MGNHCQIKKGHKTDGGCRWEKDGGGISTRSDRWEKKGLMNNSYFLKCAEYWMEWMNEKWQIRVLVSISVSKNMLQARTSILCGRRNFLPGHRQLLPVEEQRQRWVWRAAFGCKRHFVVCLRALCESLPKMRCRKVSHLWQLARATLRGQATPSWPKMTCDGPRISLNSAL